MKILFIGLGSIGKRHLRNIADILFEKNIDYSIDALRSRHLQLPADTELLIAQTYSDLSQITENYDITFICNPTHLHFQTIESILPITKHIFIEKPVFESLNVDYQRLPLQKDSIYYVACPLRYTGVLQYIKTYCTTKKVIAVRAMCSTYLPDWRPGIDYRKTYSAHANQGGGVSIDLIHEWDYLTWLFGFPTKVFNIKGKYSSLEIDSEDLSLYIAKYEDKQISLWLDYFGRIERREFELYLEDEIISADIRNQKVRFLKSGNELIFNEPRDTYQKKELNHFLEIINGQTKNDNTIEQAVKVLAIAKNSII